MFREYSHKFSPTTICVGTTIYVDTRFLWSDILKFNSYNTIYIRKNIKVNITERRQNGDWMTLTGNWLVTEMYLQFSRHNGNGEVTEWSFLAPRQWWRFVFWFNLTKKKTNFCWLKYFRCEGFLSVLAYALSKKDNNKITKIHFLFYFQA